MSDEVDTNDVDDSLQALSFEPAASKEPERLLASADGYVHKTGPRVRYEEAEAQRFARSIGIPVPSILSVETSDESIAIIMEHVDGERLDDCWAAMTQSQKQVIVHELRQAVACMRHAPPTQDYIGGIGGPAKDGRIYSDYTGGPFKREEDYAEWTLDLLDGTPRAIREALKASQKMHSRMVFTHGDLSPRNIIVRDGHIQALLDWEYAGWYPEHWEFIKFFDRPTTCKGWHDFADDLFETQYTEELVSHQALLRWQRP